MARVEDAAGGIMSDEIRFYRADEKPYGQFSNLFRREFRFEGRSFPTAEHAYQFGKARKPEVREWLMAAPSPSLLSMAAHGLYRWDIVDDWKDAKIPRMRSVLWSKFGQSPHLLELLLSTGSCQLIESATTDNAVNRFWGQVNGKGQNWLGILLMGVREDFRVGLISDVMIKGLADGVEPTEAQLDEDWAHFSKSLGR
jgi:ribA/ribD-fused uncharacterized protein